MATLNNFNNQNLKGFYLTEQDSIDLQQVILKSLYKSKKVSAFVSMDTARNGIKRFMQTGLASMRDVEQSPTVDNMFKGDLIPIVDRVIYYEFRKKVFITTPAELLTTTFANAKNYQAYKSRAAETGFNTIESHMYETVLKSLFLRKFPTINKTTGALTTEPITMDAKIEISDYNNEANVKKALGALMDILHDFRSHSSQHTDFSRKNPAYRLKGSFLISDFVLMINSPYKTAIKQVLANIFNYEQLQEAGLQEEVFNFNKIEQINFDGNTAFTVAEKTKISKTAFFLIHKDALKIISPGQMSTLESRRNNDHAHLLSIITLYGFGRLPWYPIVEGVITGNAPTSAIKEI